MSTITTSILSYSHSDHNPFDSLFDFDDLFSSTYTFIPDNERHDDSMSIIDDPVGNSSSSSEVNILKTIYDFIFIISNSD